jgi:hypothetical protein
MRYFKRKRIPHSYIWAATNQILLARFPIFSIADDGTDAKTPFLLHPRTG